MRLAFRAIYFPQTTKRAWFKVIFENRRTVLGLTKEAFGRLRNAKKRVEEVDDNSGVSAPLKADTIGS